MKNIQISDEVWAEIAKRGKFGETEDDVLQRILGISKGHIKPTPHPFRSRIRKAEIRMSSNVVSNKLVVQFENGKFKSEEFEGVTPGNIWENGCRNAEDVLGTDSVSDESVYSVFAGCEEG